MIKRYLLTKGANSRRCCADASTGTQRSSRAERFVYTSARIPESPRLELCAKWASPGLTEAGSKLADRIFSPTTHARTPLPGRTRDLNYVFRRRVRSFDLR
jgi:hypothetical protein